MVPIAPRWPQSKTRLDPIQPLLWKHTQAIISLQQQQLSFQLVSVLLVVLGVIVRSERPAVSSGHSVAIITINTMLTQL